ncbi:MAG: hypothetical protein FWE35_07625 [Streptosporangiales bacterium]|nr:hypothetical protein [Streptosporangiales bacterium]
MAEPVRSSHSLSFTLNSDGESHPLLNVLSVSVLVIGLIALGFGVVIIGSSHPSLSVAVPAGVTGLIALFGGLYTQMISVNTEQRIIIVTGMIVGFVGLAMGLAHGAFGG